MMARWGTRKAPNYSSHHHK